jgi:hypothetical protein
MSHTGHSAVLLIVFLFAAQAAFLSAQILIKNPSIPQTENLVYTEKVEHAVRTLSQSLALRSDGGASWYEFKSLSPESDVFFRLDEATLFPSFSETVTRGESAVIHRTTEILNVSVQQKDGELVIGDFESLPVVLRGLPWGTFSSARVVTLGSSGRGSPFSLRLTVAGKESVMITGRTYECWKAQLSIDGFLGSFLGKSTFWYTTEIPHYLVRSESPSNGPGSPSRVLELQTYSAE